VPSKESLVLGVAPKTSLVLGVPNQREPFDMDFRLTQEEHHAHQALQIDWPPRQSHHSTRSHHQCHYLSHRSLHQHKAGKDQRIRLDCCRD